MASLRERLRTQGLRPIVCSAPDMRDPPFLADLRREAAMMARHPENDALDDRIEANRDLEGWVSDDDFDKSPKLHFCRNDASRVCCYPAAIRRVAR